MLHRLDKPAVGRWIGSESKIAAATQVEKEPAGSHLDREDADVSPHHRIVEASAHGDHSVGLHRLVLEVQPRLDRQRKLCVRVKPGPNTTSNDGLGIKRFNATVPR